MYPINNGNSIYVCSDLRVTLQVAKPRYVLSFRAAILLHCVITFKIQYQLQNY